MSITSFSYVVRFNCRDKYSNAESRGSHIQRDLVRGGVGSLPFALEGTSSGRCSYQGCVRTANSDSQWKVSGRCVIKNAFTKSTMDRARIDATEFDLACTSRANSSLYHYCYCYHSSTAVSVQSWLLPSGALPSRPQ